MKAQMKAATAALLDAYSCLLDAYSCTKGLSPHPLNKANEAFF